MDNNNLAGETVEKTEETSEELKNFEPMDIAGQPNSVLEEAHDYLAKGKRLRVLDDVQSAADLLEQSCQLFDAYYGVGKRECADAYLEYGLALVAVADLEAGNGTDKLLKKAGIDGVSEEDAEYDDEEDEGDDEEEQQEGDENEEDDEAEAETKQQDNNNEQQTHSDELKEPASEALNKSAKAETKDTTNDTHGTEAKNNEPESQNSNQLEKEKQINNKQEEQMLEPQQPGTSKDNSNGISHNDFDDKSDDGDANDDPTTIEIAWEVLCLARRVFERDESYDGRLKLAETLQKLGEISIEWDNNENAVDILEQCLLIRAAILPESSRLIAVTYYNLGLAHSFKGNTPKANENFTNAVKVVEKNIQAHQLLLEEAKKAEDTIAIAKYTREISELKELIPEIVMRVDDTNDDDAKNSEVLKRQREEMEKEEEDIKKVCSDKSKPVDDITHLVKRRA